MGAPPIAAAFVRGGGGQQSGTEDAQLTSALKSSRRTVGGQGIKGLAGRCSSVVGRIAAARLGHQGITTTDAGRGAPGRGEALSSGFLSSTNHRVEQRWRFVEQVNATAFPFLGPVSPRFLAQASLLQAGEARRQRHRQHRFGPGRSVNSGGPAGWPWRSPASVAALDRARSPQAGNPAPGCKPSTTSSGLRLRLSGVGGCGE